MYDRDLMGARRTQGMAIRQRVCQVAIPKGEAVGDPAAVWIGAERIAPGAPIRSLGWRLFTLP
jgi:hypothetical protein